MCGCGIQTNFECDRCDRCERGLGPNLNKMRRKGMRVASGLPPSLRSSSWPPFDNARADGAVTLDRSMAEIRKICTRKSAARAPSIIFHTASGLGEINPNPLMDACGASADRPLSPELTNISRPPERICESMSVLLLSRAFGKPDFSCFRSRKSTRSLQAASEYACRHLHPKQCP